jgi:hypothetical protein
MVNLKIGLINAMIWPVFAAGFSMIAPEANKTIYYLCGMIFATIICSTKTK